MDLTPDRGPPDCRVEPVADSADDYFTPTASPSAPNPEPSHEPFAHYVEVLRGCDNWAAMTFVLDTAERSNLDAQDMEMLYVIARQRIAKLNAEAVGPQKARW